MKDPGSCAIWYVAMGKLSALSVLYKLAKEQKISDFLKKDFTVQRNKLGKVSHVNNLQPSSGGKKCL